MMKIVSIEQFEKETSLMIGLITDTIVRDKLWPSDMPKPYVPSRLFYSNSRPVKKFTVDELKWFYCYADFFTRFLYTTQVDWKKTLKNPKKSRERCYAFIAHWFDGYIYSDERFRSQHSLDLIGATQADVDKVSLPSDLIEICNENSLAIC